MRVGINAVTPTENQHEWVISNPVTSQSISLYGRETRLDKQVEVSVTGNGCSAAFFSLLGGTDGTAFFQKGKEVIVDISGLPETFVFDAITANYSNPNQQQAGPNPTLTFTQIGTSKQYSAILDRDGDEYSRLNVVVKVHRNIPAGKYGFEIIRSTDELKSITNCGIFIGTDTTDYSATPFDQSLLSSPVNVTIKLSATQGATLTDAYAVYARITTHRGPGSNLCQLAWDDTGKCYQGSYQISGSTDINDNVVQIDILSAFNDSRHSIDQVIGQQEPSTLTLDIASDSAGTRAGQKGVSYVCAGETVIVTCTPPENKAVASFQARYQKAIVNTQQQGQPSQDFTTPLEVTVLGNNQYKLTFPANAEAGSVLSISERAIPFAVSLEECDNVSYSDETSKSLEQAFTGAMADLQSGKEVKTKGDSAQDTNALKAIINGGNVKDSRIGLTAEESTLSEDEEALLEDELDEDMKVGETFDFGVSLQMAGTVQGKTQIKAVELSELSAPVEFTIENNAGFGAGTTEVWRIHEGEAEKVEGTRNAKGDVTIKADKFSTYVLAGIETTPSPTPTPDPTPTPGKGGLANTGDAAPIAVVLALVAAAGALLVLHRRSTNR